MYKYYHNSVHSYPYDNSCVRARTKNTPSIVQGEREHNLSLAYKHVPGAKSYGI